jgi:hypothetical protein
MTKSPQSPMEYLATASETSLEAFELSRLNRIACLRSEIQQVLEELVPAEVDARMAYRLSTSHALHNVLLLCPMPHSPTLPPPPARRLLSPPRLTAAPTAPSAITAITPTPSHSLAA